MNPPLTPTYSELDRKEEMEVETSPILPRPEARVFDSAYSERKPARSRPHFRIPQTPNPKIQTSEASRHLADLKKEICQEYHVVSLLGSTRTSSVEKVKCIQRGPRYGEFFALKEIKTRLFLTDSDRAAVNREYFLGNRLQHEHLVRYYRRWDIKTACFFLIEYCHQGSLTAYLTSNPQYPATPPPSSRRSSRSRRREESPLVWHVLFDMLSALAYLHSQTFVHMDVKSGNIFLNPGPNADRPVIAKLGDFGTAFQLGSKDFQEGDGVYIAPELFNGMVVLEMSTPFEINSNVWDCVRHGDIRGLEYMSIDLSSLVRLMLTVNPDERPSIVDIYAKRTTQSRLSRLSRNLDIGDPMDADVHITLEDMTLDSTPPQSPSLDERSAKKPRLSYPIKKDLFGLFNDVS